MNQGDKLEHDFTCVLTVLMFPIKHLCQQPLTDVTTSAASNNLGYWCHGSEISSMVGYCRIWGIRVQTSFGCQDNTS